MTVFKFSKVGSLSYVIHVFTDEDFWSVILGKKKKKPLLRVCATLLNT